MSQRTGGGIMNKEMEIYKNMKKRGRIYRCPNGVYGIGRGSLRLAIQEAGYTENEAYKIIEKMIEAGYIRQPVDVWGKKQGLRYIITKWVN